MIMQIVAYLLRLIIIVGLSIALVLGIIIWTNRGKPKKAIRYLRWVVKSAFLIIFMIPIAYLLGAPSVPVYSFIIGGLNESLFLAPIGQSPCVIWLAPWGQVHGTRIVDPIWALQNILAGQVEFLDLIPIIGAMFLFLVPILIMGNMFCGWICPTGSLIDSFDRVIARFLPKLDAKRMERSMRNKELRTRRQAKLTNIICPSCPLGRLSGRYGVVANGLVVSSLVGSAVLKFPVFCAVCPIGIMTRGINHVSAVSSITGKFLPIIIELWTIPIIAVLASIRERRFWCKKICPVGALLNVAGAFNPFFKPVVQADKCRIKGCPKDCEDYRLDYCFICRQMDQKNCEKVCPVDINLTDKESLSRCTKCLECYIACESDAIEIKLKSMPDAVPALARLFKGKRKRIYKPEAIAIFNEINQKSGAKLTKLKLEAQKFDLGKISKKNVSGFLVRSIERAISPEDRYYVVKNVDQRIFVTDRLLSKEIEIPVSSLGYGLRSSFYIKTFNLSNKEDFIVLSKFRNLHEVLPGITEKTLMNWKRKVEERATNFLISSNFVLPAASLSALAFYSNNPIVGVDMWSIRGLSNEEAKLQTLWFNSTLNLLQVYLLGTLNTGMKINERALREFKFLNTEKLSDTQKIELSNLFREIGAAEMPGIRLQLEDKHPLRLKLDMTILRILGYKEAEAISILNQLYPLLFEEVKLMCANEN